MKAMKLGTETGSLINHVMSSARTPEPEVGMGCTILMWSDRHPATITWVSENKKKIGIVGDKATRIDKNGMSECQSYEFSPGDGPMSIYTLRKNGRWCREGDSSKGTSLLIGSRDKYYDYSF